MSKFGIEIEAVGQMPEELSYYLWKHHCAKMYPKYRKVNVFGSEWGIMHDGSIKFDNAAGGCEIISPVMTRGDFPALAKIIEAAKEAGCKVNKSCASYSCGRF